MLALTRNACGFGNRSTCQTSFYKLIRDTLREYSRDTFRPSVFGVPSSSDLFAMNSASSRLDLLPTLPWPSTFPRDICISLPSTGFHP